MERGAIAIAGALRSSPRCVSCSCLQRLARSAPNTLRAPPLHARAPWRSQGNPNNALAPQYSSLPRALYYSLKHEGVRKLFSGLLPRSVRLVVAVFILTGVRNTLIDVVEEIRR